MTQKIFKARAKQFIQNKLVTDMVWMLKGLNVVFNNQTDIEQLTEDTKLHNRKGFTPADAKFCCSVAKKAGRYPLSEKQVFVLRKRLPKYWKQIYVTCDMEKLTKLIAA